MITNEEQQELAKFLDDLVGYMCENDCDMGEQGSSFINDINEWIKKLEK